MNDFDDLDDVFGPLRSAATPAELASESAIVDAMARNHRHTKGSTMFSSRRIRVAAFVAAGVLGFSGVAAAGYGDSLDTSELEFTTTENEEDLEEAVDEVEEEVEEEVEDAGDEVGEIEDDVDGVDDVEESAFTESVIEEVVEDEPVEVALDDPDTYFREDKYCIEGNHGKTVSAAARGDQEYLDKLELDGVEYTQSQVAQSSCGKDYEGVVVDEDIDDLEDKQDVEEKDVEDDDDKDDDDKDDEKKKKPSRADKPGRPDHAGSRSNGKKNRD